MLQDFPSRKPASGVELCAGRGGSHLHPHIPPSTGIRVLPTQDVSSSKFSILAPVGVWGMGCVRGLHVKLGHLGGSVG